MPTCIIPDSKWMLIFFYLHKLECVCVDSSCNITVDASINTFSSNVLGEIFSPFDNSFIAIKISFMISFSPSKKIDYFFSCVVGIIGGCFNQNVYFHVILISISTFTLICKLLYKRHYTVSDINLVILVLFYLSTNLESESITKFNMSIAKLTLFFVSTFNNDDIALLIDLRYFLFFQKLNQNPIMACRVVFFLESFFGLNVSMLNKNSKHSVHQSLIGLVLSMETQQFAQF